MTPEKALAKAEKDKKDLYLLDCLEHRYNFSPMVYCMDGITRTEDLVAQSRLAALIIFKLTR